MMKMNILTTNLDVAVEEKLAYNLFSGLSFLWLATCVTVVPYIGNILIEVITNTSQCLYISSQLLKTANFGNRTTELFRFLQNTNLHKTDYNSKTRKIFDIL